MPKPVKSQPFMKPLAVSIVVDGLRVVIPAATLLGVIALIVAPAWVWMRSQEPRQQLLPEEPIEQSWTTGAPLAAMTAVVPGKLPDEIDSRQRRHPCDPDLEVAIAVNGVMLCWIPLDVKICPKGKAWVHEGKCYGRALKAEKPPRGPTSGEPRPGGIADH